MRNWLIAISVLIVQGSMTLPLQAQSWSIDRNRPALWEIVSLDATGETGWPYGEEDVADDGFDQFNTEEAGVDLRSVYADADADRFWMRAYVALDSTPPASTVAFLFIDTDARETTGGTAAATEIWADFDDDPTDGGYERAIGFSGDGTLVGVWRWNVQNSNWTTQPNQADEVNVEVGIDRDPILIAGARHGYLQVDVDHEITQLTASCDASLFVRLWNDDTPDNSFGDDEPDASACRVAIGTNGDPEVLDTTGCTSDDDCPAVGICYNGRCYFTYSCTADADCRSGEACVDGACVQVVDTRCQDNADCDGLICDSGTCVPCSDSGEHACDDGSLCTPGGSCVVVQDNGNDGDSTGGSGGSGSASGSGGTESPGPDVKGGAFHCGVASRPNGCVASPKRGATRWILFLLMSFVFLSTRRHVRQS